MKYLLILLLLSLSCHAQKLPDDVKVTAYRVVMAGDDGPNMIKNHLNYGGALYYATAETSNKPFADALLKLNKYALQNAVYDEYSREGGIGNNNMPNMFVISGTNIADTLFTNYSNRKIFYPYQHKTYTDDKKELINAFPENIREFYEYDFNRHLRYIFDGKRDSVPVSLIRYKNQPFTELAQKLKSSPKPFTLVSTDSVDSMYTAMRDTVFVSKNGASAIIHNPKSGWDIAGIKIGDSEEALKKKFPLSTEAFFITEIRFEDIKRRYYYEVKITSNGGDIRFNIVDGKIESITLYYYK